MPEPDTEQQSDEKGEDKKAGSDQKGGMSQSSKDDIGVVVVILAITLLAIVVVSCQVIKSCFHGFSKRCLLQTAIKIVLLDVQQYPELFGADQTVDSSTIATPSVTDFPQI